MSVDLLLSQTIPQKSSTGVQSCKIGLDDRDRSSKIQTIHDLDSRDDGNFLSTLKNVSPDETAAEPRPDAVAPRSCDSTAPVTGNENDEAIGDLTATFDMALHENGDAEPALIMSTWVAFIRILENMGQKDAFNGSGLQQMADLNPADDNQMSTVKELIARFQQHQQVPDADLSAGFQRLQHFLTNELKAMALMPFDQNSVNRISSNQVANLAQIHQQLKELIYGIQEAKPTSEWHMGKGISAAALPEAVPLDTGGGAETAGRSFNIDSSMRGTASTTLAADTRASLSINQQDMPAVHAIENADADPSKVKDKLGLLPDSRTINRTESADRMGFAPGQDQQTGNGKPSDNQLLQPNASSGGTPVTVKASAGPVRSIAGEESYSKIFQENQLAKEGVVEVQTGKNDETVSKVLKIEAGTNGNALLNSPGSSTITSAETASSAKDIEVGQNQLRNTTVGQIVRKAALHLKNGQHEAKIELKPEFLGHIRMQVISENQQVTVKILAQHGFVKDMIESNVHQLKADLQQQGLEVDKLEVSVSRDSEDSGNSKEKLTQFRTKHGSANHKNEERPTEDQQKDSKQLRKSSDSGSAVDYFA